MVGGCGIVKTTKEIRQWIKKTFKDAGDFDSFLSFVHLHGFVQQGRKFPLEDQALYEALRAQHYAAYHNIAHLPELKITERFGKEIHTFMLTPLLYMDYFYGCDEKRMRALFQTTLQRLQKKRCLL